MPTFVGWRHGKPRGRTAIRPDAAQIVSTRINVLAFLAAVIAVVVAFHLFSPTDWPPLAVDILHSLHGPGFVAVALGVFWYLQSRFASLINYLLAAGITMAIGLISEISQIPGPRDAQIKDLVVDGIAILGALGIVASFDTRVRTALGKPARVIIPVLASVALTMVCVPTLWYSYALVQQKRAFPVLLSFEQAWETATFDQTSERRPDVVDAPVDWPVKGDKVSRSTENGRWGIFLSLHAVQDWRGYSQLSFVAAANSSRFAMDIGVRELRPADRARANRYYSSVWVELEPQRFTITFEEIQTAMKDRPFDFSRIEAVVFSAATPGDENVLLIDDIRLEL